MSMQDKKINKFLATIETIRQGSALAYCLCRYRKNHSRLSYELEQRRSYSDFLNMSFTWSDSPQGHDYWDFICKQLERQEIEEARIRYDNH